MVMTHPEQWIAGDRQVLIPCGPLELEGEVIQMNRSALERMIRCRRELRIVNGATHLFEEPGALRIVAGHASEWFRTHLGLQGGEP